ncbi:MAG: family 1 encapsulin nanocompartment shell protein [Planctomycetota bacterium]
MSDKFLHRGDAPFGDAVWHAIDEAVLSAAKSQLTARRLLHTDGPFGLGLKTVPGPEEPGGDVGKSGVAVTAAGGTPVALIQTTFAIAARDIASFEASGLPMDLGPAAQAGIACASQEDDLLFNGAKDIGAAGLLGAKGTQSIKLADWEAVGAAADNLIEAVTTLDDAGFHGPYTLALAPRLYNRLFRRYPQGNQTELDHARTIVTDGILKAPSVAKGGVLLASGRQYASIVIGQDIKVGFIGPADGDYEFTVSETLALRLVVPEAVCVLK